MEDDPSSEADIRRDSPIVETRETAGKTWQIKRYTAEHHKPPVSHVPKSAYVPGFGGTKASSRACPKCGFLAFGWSKECSKCGEPL